MANLSEIASSYSQLTTGPLDQELVILIGGGDGALIDHVYSHLNCMQTLMVVDHEPPAFELPGHPNLVFSFNESVMACLARCRAILNDKYELRFRVILESCEDPGRRHSLEQMAQFVTVSVRELIAELTFDRYMAEIIIQHLLLNLPLAAQGQGGRALQGIAGGCTAVVIGAGPSVSSQLPWVAANRDRLFVVATGSVVRALQQHAIVPDLFVETDIRAADHWEGLDCSGYRLLATPQITPGLASRFGTVFWCQSTAAEVWQQEVMQRLLPDCEVLPLGGNSGVFAAVASIYAGCQTICLCGIDLCMTLAGNTHSDLHTHGRDQLAGGHGSADRYATVMTNRGQCCKTIFQSFIIDFEALIERHSDVTFIQTSADGVVLRGAQFRPVAELSCGEQNIGAIQWPAGSGASALANCREIYRWLHEQLVDVSAGAVAGEAGKGSLADQLQNVIANGVRQRLLWSGPDTIDFAAIQGYEVHRICEQLKVTVESGLHLLRAAPMMADRPSALATAYRMRYPEVGIPVDMRWEISQLRQYHGELAQQVSSWHENGPAPQSNAFRVVWQRKHMIQLRVRDSVSGQFVPTAGFYDLAESAKSLVFEAMDNWRAAGVDRVGIIVCFGIMDANYLWLLRTRFPGVRLVVVEPSFDLFVSVLRYVPLASMLGADSVLLIGDDAGDVIGQVARLRAGLPVDGPVKVLCADSEGHWFPELPVLAAELERAIG